LVAISLTRENEEMDIEAFRNRLKEKAGTKAGMILIHNGLVREYSRNGSPCSSLDMEVDFDKLSKIMEEARKLPGVLAAEVEISQGHLEKGEDVMLLGIAGDFRENVISALSHCLDRIKKEVTRKIEQP